ncbi:hypothetical protein [Flavobacterium sp. 3HN19-14]|uniref:hypothetical protein n=1 Tax=Flavobacterium sp. 3HN19-14 TaxID=3448133 RepID=UPI003EE2E0E5
MPTFIFTKTEDKPEYYSQKIWLTKLQKDKLYNKQKIVNQYNSLDEQKNLDNLIYDTTDYFLSEKDENIWTFDDIVKDKKFVDGQKIIEFEVAANQTPEQLASWIKLITTYINEMQSKFYANDRRDKIYVIIVVLYEEKITTDDMEQIISQFQFMEPADDSIPKIEVLNLQKLERVNLTSLKEWVDSNFNDFPNEKTIIIDQLNQYNPNTTYTYQQVIEEFKFKI